MITICTNPDRCTVLFVLSSVVYCLSVLFELVLYVNVSRKKYILFAHELIILPKTEDNLVYGGMAAGAKGEEPQSKCKENVLMILTQGDGVNVISDMRKERLIR